MGETAWPEARRRLAAGLEQMGLAVDAGRQERLIAYLKLLQRWNETYNLTAVRDPRDMVPRHLLDSLAVRPYLFGDRLLDLGTGAGLPGIPLAVVAPRRSFHLLDSNGKKTRFVRQAAMELGLGNVAVVQARMESYLPDRKFATIISRAVTSLSDLSAVADRLLARPARLLVMKGRDPDKELRDPGRRAGYPRIHRLRVPFLDEERHLIDVSFD
jgi:16S rRNA (guanine527-N7)-methyltransferase